MCSEYDAIMEHFLVLICSYTGSWVMMECEDKIF